MTTRQVAQTAPPGTYSEIIRGEIKAECARRDISQRGVAMLLGLSQPAVSDRWRGRTPWSLNEIERLESVLGLSRGALLLACARRDSNPQPSDLSPLQVWPAVAGMACFECLEAWCAGSPTCACPCHDDIEKYDNLAALRTSASAGCFECRELGCGGELACDCGCHEDVEQFDDLAGLAVLLAAASADTQAWELDDEEEYRRGQCVICSGDCDPGQCVQFADLGAAVAASACQIDHNRVTECDECGRCVACDECRCYADAWELAA